MSDNKDEVEIVNHKLVNNVADKFITKEVNFILIQLIHRIIWLW